MHYCVNLITTYIPSDNDIERILKPYYSFDIDWEKDEKPVFSWDCWSLGGRYCGLIKLKINENDEEYRWGILSAPREGRLFLSNILRELREETKPRCFFEESNYYGYMGDGYLRVDGARIRDILNLNDLGCYIFIDKDGNAFARETWNGSSFDEDKHFDDKYKATLQASKDCFLTVLDIHD